jgi:hypothetical protein
MSFSFFSRGKYSATPPTLTDQQAAPMALDVNANVQTNVVKSVLPTGAAQDGTDATGVVAPTGAVGIRGWLSGIYAALKGSIAVTGTFWQAIQPVSGTFWQTTQPVSIASMPTTPVTGTVTANAGTNLNTSALAVESGGNLAAAKTDLDTIAAAQGTGATGVAQPTGGTGLLGWLSGIYNVVANLTQRIVGAAAAGTAALGNPVLTGHQDVTTGLVRNSLCDAYGNAEVVIGGSQVDAFGRARSAQPETLYSASFKYDLQPLLMEVVNTGGGTTVKTTNVSSATLSTGSGTSGDGTKFISHGYWRYEPGKSQAISMSGVIGAYKQNVRKIVGYYDTNDGLFFDMNGNQGASGVIGCTLRSSTSGSPVDTTVLQSSWNIDKMDGTGVSGITLDFTKTQILFIDLQWLGSGRVRFGFVVNGLAYHCHQFVYANVVASTFPYMNTGSLPIAWQILNTAAATGATTMTAICASVVSEGGSQSPQTLQFSAGNGVTSKNASNSILTPLVSIQVATTFQGSANRSIYKLIKGFIFDSGAASVYWQLVYNPTLTGASFAAFDATHSGMNVDVAATASSGGIVVASGYCQNGNTFFITPELLEGLEIPFTINAGASVGDIFTLQARSVGANSQACYAELSWSEDR